MKHATDEIEAKAKVLQRLLISYNDFQQASWIASYIVESKLQAKVERLRGKPRYRTKLLWQALNCAMIVAYCRPFSGNDRGRAGSRVPDLPSRVLRVLDGDEKELHDVTMKDRHTMLAHSDSDAWNLRPVLLESDDGRKILAPFHNDTRAPLVHAEVERLQQMCGKLMEVVMEERLSLEKELADFLPTISISEDEERDVSTKETDN